MPLEAVGLAVRLGRLALGPLDLALGPGVWHLAGPNGAGKSTLLRLLAGALAPDAGAVRVDGRDVYAEPRARRAVGWVPVEPEHPDFLTVGEAWRFTAALRGAPGWDGRARTAALDVPEDLVLGNASLGQRRKAALVAALAGDPGVLLLDEVFAPLDAAAAQVVAGWLDAWRRSRVVVVTGHGALPVRVDGTFVLVEGRVEIR